MLISNLSVLLAQRRLTITRVSQDTRISRTTLTALCGGSAKGVQFETLNALCQYLKVAPGDLFLYCPFDLTAACEGRLGRSTVEFTVRRAGRREERIALDCDARTLCAPDGHALEALRVRLALPEGNGPAAQRAAELVDLLQSLPAPMLSDLELEILRPFDQNLPASLAPDRSRDYSPDLLWPWQS